MANSGSVLQQIGESFEDIGKDIARETVQAPKDIVGTALESLGVSSGQKKNPKQTAPADPQGGQENAPAAPGPSDEVKRAVARAALRELSGQSQPKELSVWEKIQKEEEQKKEMEKKQKEQARRQALPQATGKRPRGDLYGKKAKQTNMENKSKRQD